jgi:hypothetical protein
MKDFLDLNFLGNKLRISMAIVTQTVLCIMKEKKMMNSLLFWLENLMNDKLKMVPGHIYLHH